MAREEFDVCVIGTGAGGGVMLQELTVAGFRVVALVDAETLEVQASKPGGEWCLRTRHFSAKVWRQVRALRKEAEGTRNHNENDAP